MSRDFEQGDDPLNHLIYAQVRPEIRLLLEHGHWTGAVKLIYSGIDTMAYLGLPEERTFVKGEDFSAWCDAYLHFPCAERISGREWWSARCGMAHTHTVESQSTISGACRRVLYMSDANPAIIHEAQIGPTIVMVSVRALAEAFFEGTDRFLLRLFANPRSARAANSRLPGLVMPMRTSEEPPAPT